MSLMMMMMMMTANNKARKLVQRYLVDSAEENYTQRELCAFNNDDGDDSQE